MESINEIDFMNEMTFKPHSNNQSNQSFHSALWEWAEWLIDGWVSWMLQKSGIGLNEFVLWWVKGGTAARQPANKRNEQPNGAQSTLLSSSSRRNEVSWRRERENKLKRLMLALIFLICGLWASGPSARSNSIQWISSIHLISCCLPSALFSLKKRRAPAVNKD